jgi:hypothetical protein
MRPCDPEPLIELLENTANFLRGLTLDPAVPLHAKQAIIQHYELLETVCGDWTRDAD